MLKLLPILVLPLSKWQNKEMVNIFFPHDIIKADCVAFATEPNRIYKCLENI